MRKEKEMCEMNIWKCWEQSSSVRKTEGKKYDQKKMEKLKDAIRITNSLL